MINKTLIEKIKKKNPNYTNKTIDSIVSSTLEVIKEEIENGRYIKFVGLFTLLKVRSKKKIGRNVKKNTPITIPAKYRPKVIWHKSFRNRINNVEEKSTN